MRYRTETQYQRKLTEKLEKIFPGCVVLQNDPQRNQGFPDLLVLLGSHWFMLEVKLTEFSDHQPNQPYYVDLFDRMSFAAFIYPENEDQVLDALQRSFGVSW